MPKFLHLTYGDTYSFTQMSANKHYWMALTLVSPNGTYVGVAYIGMKDVSIVKVHF